MRAARKKWLYRTYTASRPCIKTYGRLFSENDGNCVKFGQEWTVGFFLSLTSTVGFSLAIRRIHRVVWKKTTLSAQNDFRENLYPTSSFNFFFHSQYAPIFNCFKICISFTFSGHNRKSTTQILMKFIFYLTYSNHRSPQPPFGTEPYINVIIFFLIALPFDMGNTSTSFYQILILSSDRRLDRVSFFILLKIS